MLIIGHKKNLKNHSIREKRNSINGPFKGKSLSDMIAEELLYAIIAEILNSLSIIPQTS